MRTMDQILEGEDFNQFIIKCYIDFKFWAERVFGLTIKPFHMDWINAVKANRRVAILAPTGFGKTTVLGNCYVLWNAWFKPQFQAMIVSSSLKQSGKILEEIRMSIEDNEMLRSLVPEQALVKSWTKSEIILANGVKVFCCPLTPSIKGYHVDYVLADEAAEYDDKDLFYRYLTTRTNSKNGTVCCISTPVSPTDLMQDLLHNKEYWGGSFPAIVDGQSIFPEKFSMEKLELIKRENPMSFEREYILNPKAEMEGTLYPPYKLLECFDYQQSFTLKDEGGIKILACDFAISSGPRADYDAYIVIEKFGDRVIIRHGERHHGLPIAAKIQRLKELYAEHRISKILVDQSQVGHAVIEEIRAACLPIDGVDFSSYNRGTMLIDLKRVVDEKRLVIPRDSEDMLTMTFTNTLIDELADMYETKTKVGNRTFLSKGAHDDTVMALAMAVKGAIAQKEFLDYVAV